MSHTNNGTSREVAVAQKFERPLRNDYPPSGATMIKNAPKLQSVGCEGKGGGDRRMLNKQSWLLGEQF